MFRFTLLLALGLVACSRAPLNAPIQSAHDDEWTELAVDIGNQGYIDAPAGAVVDCAPGPNGTSESCGVRIRESLEVTLSYDRSDAVSGDLAALKEAQPSPIVDEGSNHRGGFWAVFSVGDVHHLVARSIHGFIKCEAQTTDSAQLPILIRVCSSYSWESVH